VSFFRFGAFRSATQSSRQAWCAVRAQGQGETHSESAGVSSVSSEKQIQHLRGSGAGGAVEEPAVACAVEMGELGLGESFCEEEGDVGVSISNVWESSEVKE